MSVSEMSLIFYHFQLQVRHYLLDATDRPLIVS